MHVGTIFRNSFARVRSVTHDGDLLACLNRLADLERGQDLLEVRIDGENRHAFDVVAQNDVISVIGEAGLFVHVHDSTVGGRHYPVDWLAAPVALKAPNVQAFVHLPSFGSHAAEHA